MFQVFRKTKQYNTLELQPSPSGGSGGGTGGHWQMVDHNLFSNLVLSKFCGVGLSRLPASYPPPALIRLFSSLTQIYDRQFQLSSILYPLAWRILKNLLIIIMLLKMLNWYCMHFYYSYGLLDRVCSGFLFYSLLCYSVWYQAMIVLSTILLNNKILADLFCLYCIFISHMMLCSVHVELCNLIFIWLSKMLNNSVFPKHNIQMCLCYSQFSIICKLYADDLKLYSAMNTSTDSTTSSLKHI